MKLPPLVGGQLIRRYKRFLADVTLDDGSTVTAHCPNTGAMTGCAEPGSRVWLSRSGNPARKYPFSWELVETAGGELACIHSARANALALEGITTGVIRELQGYEDVQREVKFGREGSRVDLLLQGKGKRCFVEVKSVTLDWGEGLGLFPDARSDRGRKHLRELAAIAATERAVLVFAALHTGLRRVAPADSIDPAYGQALREALAAGVEVLAYGCEIFPGEMRLTAALPVLDRQPGVEAGNLNNN